jgi:beta-phosphoglucomutase
MKFSSIIFDMDGVLVDNNDFHYRSFEAFCQKYNLTITPEIYNVHITGRTNEMILQYFFGNDITQEKIDELAFEKEAIYRDIFRPYMKPAPGLTQLLEKIHSKGVTCAVASNGPFENIDFVLDETGIRNYFKEVVNATMVKEGKPAPDIYLKAAELLGKSTKDCVVFEDSPTGIKAALAAGIKVIGMSTTHEEHELLGVEFIIKDFTDPRLVDLF